MIFVAQAAVLETAGGDFTESTQGQINDIKNTFMQEDEPLAAPAPPAIHVMIHEWMLWSHAAAPCQAPCACVRVPLARSQFQKAKIFQGMLQTPGFDLSDLRFEPWCSLTSCLWSSGGWQLCERRRFLVRSGRMGSDRGGGRGVLGGVENGSSGTGSGGRPGPKIFRKFWGSGRLYRIWMSGGRTGEGPKCASIRPALGLLSAHFLLAQYHLPYFPPRQSPRPHVFPFQYCDCLD